MSVPMDGDENPYRFTGGASEGVSAERPHDSPGRLRTVAYLRSLLSAALALYVSSLAILLVAPAIQWASPLNAPRNDFPIVGLANVAVQVGYTVVVIFGVMLIPRACPRFSKTKTTLILMPVLNAIIAILALRDSKRTLEDRGVRVGWLTCDYSQAIV